MYFVAGLTGNTGAAAAETLLAGGHKVRALVRDARKAQGFANRGVELVEGHLDDAGALATALRGVRAAYLMVPPNVGADDPVGEYAASAAAYRKAARAAGLKRLVVLSSEAAQHNSGNGPIRGSHIVETVLAGAVDSVTFLRASFFQENWQSVFGLAQTQGVMPTFFADLDKKRSMIATKDIGRVAAEMLLEEKGPDVAELGSRELYSARDAADAMAKVLGRPVTPVQPPRDQWTGILQGAGLSPAMAHLIAEMNDGINSGRVSFAGEGRQVKGRIALADTIASWKA